MPNLKTAILIAVVFLIALVGGATAQESLGPDRVILFTASWCPPCKEDAPKIQSAFKALRKAGWKVGRNKHDQIQIVDIDETRLDEALGVPYVPLYCKIENGKIVRRLERGCSTPLDQWSLGFLYKGVSERPRPKRESVTAVVIGGYPVRGGWWSVDDRWRPSRSYLVSHLLNNSNHRGKFDLNWLRGLTMAELHSVHSDDHEGRLKLRFVNAGGGL